MLVRCRCPSISFSSYDTIVCARTFETAKAKGASGQYAGNVLVANSRCDIGRWEWRWCAGLRTGLECFLHPTSALALGAAGDYVIYQELVLTTKEVRRHSIVTVLLFCAIINCCEVHENRYMICIWSAFRLPLNCFDSLTVTIVDPVWLADLGHKFFSIKLVNLFVLYRLMFHSTKLSPADVDRRISKIERRNEKRQRPIKTRCIARPKAQYRASCQGNAEMARVLYRGIRI